MTNTLRAVQQEAQPETIDCYGGQVRLNGNNMIVFVDAEGHAFANIVKTGKKSAIVCVTTNKEDIVLKNHEDAVVTTSKALPGFILEATNMLGVELDEKDVQMCVSNNKFRYKMKHAISDVKTGAYKAENN